MTEKRMFDGKDKPDCGRCGKEMIEDPQTKNALEAWYCVKCKVRWHVPHTNGPMQSGSIIR